jgi:hypothetical protein
MRHDMLERVASFLRRFRSITLIDENAVRSMRGCC